MNTLRVYAGGPAEHRALEAWRFASGGAQLLHRIDFGVLLRLQHRLCFMCISAMDMTNGGRARNPEAWTWEHVFPRGVGGGDKSNVLLAHRRCNDLKSSRWPFPCEVIYLAAIYAEPYDAPLMRLAKAAQIVARNQRRRYAIERAHA